MWEWCADWYEEDYYKHSPRVKPRGPETGSYRVYRGGCWWYAHAAYFRGAYRRGWPDPAYRFVYLGFRLVRTAS